jgi:chaperonin GroEL
MDGSIVVGKLIDQYDVNFGFDAQTGEFGDLVRVGIIDPAKAVWVALQDAGSVAGLLITTEAMAAEKPEPKAAAAALGTGGMDF